MPLLRFIVWPLSWLVKFILDHVSELPEYLVLSLHPLLLAEHGQRALLVRRINLVFFPQPVSKRYCNVSKSFQLKNPEQHCFENLTTPTATIFHLTASILLCLLPDITQPS